MSKQHLISVAQETLKAIDDGFYTAPSGKIVEIKNSINYSIYNSILYKPGLLNVKVNTNTSPIIEVTKESTLDAAYRLRDENPCILNFASAIYVGGGFLEGSPAQEEFICRCSGLYPCLISQPEYYEANNQSPERCGYYLDYAIYSADVPVFRDKDYNWLEHKFTTSVITSPAPFKTLIFDNISNNEFDDAYDKLELVFEKRMEQVLKVMADQGHRTIVLGAWGCGAFGNEPYMVSEMFKEKLQDYPYFDKVVFAIYGKDDNNLNAFKEVFSD